MKLDQGKLLVIAGPCVVESLDLLRTVAEHMVTITADLPVQYVFKSSYRKANRTSANSFQGIGDELALQHLATIREEFGVPVLTDIHTDDEAALAAQYADVLQIPAFLSRQTSLLEAAARTGKVVNIKKAQFMAADDMPKAAAKVIGAGNANVWLTERGTSFGYHDLVVDYRGMVDMLQTGLPVIFDATHSVQRPSIGAQSGGQPQYILPLALAAVAIGVTGLFMETHPDPPHAMSDAATQLPLQKMSDTLARILDVWKAVQ